MASLARTRRGPRHDHPRARATVIRGVAVLIVALALGDLALRLYDGVPTANYRTVYVSTPIVGNLLSHDAVRVAGKRVGQVLKIDLGRDGKPRVQLQLSPGTKLPADTGVRVRANGLLGARFVELVPGKSSALLADDAVIHGTDTSYTYGLPEFVDVFDSRTREGLQQTLRGLGAGMLGNGAGLNATIKTVRVRAPQFDDIMRSIRAHEGSAARLLPATAAAFTVFERNTAYVKPWTQAVGDALEPFITERQATRDTLEAAAPALASADTGLGHGVKLLAAVRHLSAAAAGTLPPAPEGVKALSALLAAGGAPLKRSLPLVQEARAGINAPVDILPALEPVRPRLDEAMKDVRPMLQELADHSCDLKNGAATLRSMTGLEQTGNGEVGRGMAFRLQLVVPGVDGVGLGGPGTLFKRAIYPPDCFYKSRPYPQFAGDGTKTRSGR